VLIGCKGCRERRMRMEGGSEGGGTSVSRMYQESLSRSYGSVVEQDRVEQVRTGKGRLERARRWMVTWRIPELTREQHVKWAAYTVT
jgi:hypothetical protein